jgi:hypothetical protein
MVVLTYEQSGEKMAKNGEHKGDRLEKMAIFFKWLAFCAC